MWRYSLKSISNSDAYNSHTCNFKQCQMFKLQRKISCGCCINCLAKECGFCRYCCDMFKFGGKNTLKKRCAQRMCRFQSLKTICKSGRCNCKYSQMFKGHRKTCCGLCKNCLAGNCGSCRYCSDKFKFGGENTLRKRCIKRNCKFKSWILRRKK